MIGGIRLCQLQIRTNDGRLILRLNVAPSFFYVGNSDRSRQLNISSRYKVTNKKIYIYFFLLFVLVFCLWWWEISTTSHKSIKWSIIFVVVVFHCKHVLLLTCVLWMECEKRKIHSSHLVQWLPVVSFVYQSSQSLGSMTPSRLSFLTLILLPF